MSTVRFVLEFEIATIFGNLWIKLNPWSSLHRYIMFLSDLIVHATKAVLSQSLWNTFQYPQQKQSFRLFQQPLSPDLPNFFHRVFLVFPIGNALRVSFENFGFFPLASIALWRTSWRTSRFLTPFSLWPKYYETPNPYTRLRLWTSQKPSFFGMYE